LAVLGLGSNHGYKTTLLSNISVRVIEQKLHCQ